MPPVPPPLLGFRRASPSSPCPSRGRKMHNTRIRTPRARNLISTYFADQFDKTIWFYRRACPRAVEFVSIISYLFPRKQREALLGDLLEDIDELQTQHVNPLRIWFTLIWQLSIILLSLGPRLVKWFALGWLVDKVKHWWAA